MAIFGYFLKIESVQKVIDYTLKMKSLLTEDVCN